MDIIPSPEQIETKAPKTISIKTVIIILVVLILAGLAFYYKSLFIAAMVDSRPISRFAVIRRIEKQSGKLALDAIINEMLIGNEARVKGITVNNDEVEEQLKTIEAQITAQGGTLDSALGAEGLTRDDLKRQIIVQKQAEKILAETIQVSDNEVEAYIAEIGLTIPTGQEEVTRNQIREQLLAEKRGAAFNQFITDLRAKAKINYYINY